MEAVREDNAYSSPAYKLREFFEKSRDRWKTKALEAQAAHPATGEACC